MSLTWVSPAGIIIEFSNTSDTYRLISINSGLPDAPVTHMTRQAPYQDGLSRIDTHFEPRIVNFDVMVMAPTFADLEYAVKNLTLALNPMPGPGYLIYTYDDGTEYILYCIRNSPMQQSGVGNDRHRLVSIDLVAHDPFIYSYPSTITYFFAGDPLVYPYEYPFTYPTGTAQQTVMNEGDIASEVTIVLTGAVVNPVITRTWADQYGVITTDSLSFTLTMTAGEVLTITTGFGNNTIRLLHDTGLYDTNPFQYLNPGSTFWRLVTGINTIAVTSTSISAGTITTVETMSKFSGV